MSETPVAGVVRINGSDVRTADEGAGLRVLHVVEAFGGGVYEMVRLLACGLADRGHSVGIAYGVRPETPPEVEDTFDDRIELFATPWTKRTLAVQAAAFAQLRALRKSFRPDIVHLHSSFAGTVGAAALAGDCPTIYTPHGYAFEAPNQRGRHTLIRTVERRVAARVAAIGAVSMSEAAQAARLGTADRIVTVPNGIPEFDALLRRPPQVDAPRRVVAMGRIMPQRQPARTAMILNGLKDVAEVQWIGGGRDDDPGPRVALAKAGVPVTGWLSRDEALKRLDGSAVYVHWTAWDGHPLSILEAIARDVVVVASDIPANREIVGSKQVFTSPEAAQDFIRRVLLDDDFRAEVLISQHHRAHRFGAGAMVENWLELYRSVSVARAPVPVYAATPPAPV